MFGVYRTLLAIFVLLGHLYKPYQLGTYAVFGFYVLSGFLMTTIMHQTYGYTSDGRKKYYINRFLRIYPTYWIAILLSLILLTVFGGRITEFHKDIFFPTSLEGILRNILLIFKQDSAPRLSPATWALSVELFFYFCIGIGISHNKKITWIWFLTSIGITLYLLIFLRFRWEYRYFPIYSASLPFSIGSMLYFYNEQLVKSLQKIKMHSPVILFLLISINFLICYMLEIKTGINLIYGFGFYANLVLCSCSVISLSQRSFPFVNRKLDKLIGSLSYPIYLLHWQVGFLVFYLMFGVKPDSDSIQSIVGTAVALLATILIAFVIAHFWDDKIEKIRSRYKSH